MNTNFLLGTIKFSEAVRSTLKRLPYDLLARHAINEHGHLSPKELTQNINGMKMIGRIVSRYRADPTDTKSKFILIITKPTWTETVVLIE